MTTIILPPPTRDKRGYRLRCRFKSDPYPMESRLDREKVVIAEKFVADMHKQGWEHDGRYGFKLTGPFPMIPAPITIRPRRMRTAREMLSGVMQGQRFRDEGENYAQPMPKLVFSEYWEYEISAIFVREEILTEYPDPHEEER